MEVACSPSSILSTMMAEKFGEGAIRRVGSWNGHKLGTPAGDQKSRAWRRDTLKDMGYQLKSGSIHKSYFATNAV